MLNSPCIIEDLKVANITLGICKDGREIPMKTPKATAITVVMIDLVPSCGLFTILQR